MRAKEENDGLFEDLRVATLDKQKHLAKIEETEAQIETLELKVLELEKDKAMAL